MIQQYTMLAGYGCCTWLSNPSWLICVARSVMLAWSCLSSASCDWLSMSGVSSTEMDRTDSESSLDSVVEDTAWDP